MRLVWSSPSLASGFALCLLMEKTAAHENQIDLFLFSRLSEYSQPYGLFQGGLYLPQMPTRIEVCAEAARHEKIQESSRGLPYLKAMATPVNQYY